jgi:hypothetical protein
MTPGAQQGPDGSASAAGAENSNVILREVSGKLDALIGDLTQQSRACGGTAPKLAAVPALSVPAVLCRRNLCARLDRLDDHLAAIVVSHAV